MSSQDFLTQSGVGDWPTSGAGHALLAELSQPALEQLDACCRRFESACRATLLGAAPPSLESFLGEITEPGLRRALFHELLVVELEWRRGRGDVVGVVEYLQRFPGDDDLVRMAWSEVHALVSTDIAVGTVPVTVKATTSSSGGPPGRMPDGQFGPYRIVREVGRGGMGVVYEAIHEPLNRRVALKVLPPQFLCASSHALARFRREARAIAALEHPSIVTVYDVGEHDGFHYLAMRFIAGPSLALVLREEGERAQVAAARLTPPQVARLGLAVADALAHTHRNGILHRDVKPSNLMLDAEGAVHVTDFGLARLTGDEEEPTTAGTVVGTARYLPPEAFHGRYDARTDVYSLGATLYELLTLQPAFAGDTPLAVMHAVCSASPPAPRQLNPAVPAALEDLVKRAMARQPEARPTAAQLAAELRQFLTGPTATPPASFRHRRGVAAVCGGLALMAAWGWQLARHRPDVVPQPDRPNSESTVIAALSAAAPSNRPALTPTVVTGALPATAPPHLPDGPPGLAGDVIKEPGASPDRTAANWVLSIGGMVRVNGQPRVISVPADLPEGSFRLTWVFLKSNKQASNADFAHFRGCKNLTGLSLDGSPVGDQGLAYFKECTNLTYLGLPGTQVTDEGLASFKECPNLTFLSLTGTHVSDDGLVNFKECPNLTFLSLDGTLVSDKGLANFKGCTKLSILGLEHTRVSDEGMVHLQNCKDLTIVTLRNTGVGDQGLAHFKNCKNLTGLVLSGTLVSDGGLVHFEDCKSLWNLDLGNTNVTDVGLAHFKGCKSLQSLSLNGTQVSDEGLAHFKDCKGLTFLQLSGTQVGNEGVAHFKDCKHLAYLDLKQTRVSAAMIEDMKKALPMRVIESDAMWTGNQTTSK